MDLSIADLFSIPNKPRFLKSESTFLSTHSLETTFSTSFFVLLLVAFLDATLATS
jgi:hypothetical protein